MQSRGVTFNTINSGAVGENNDIDTMILYSVSPAPDGDEAQLFKYGGKVEKALKELKKKRMKKIEKMFEEEKERVTAESKAYIKSVEGREGEIAAFSKYQQT